MKQFLRVNKRKNAHYVKKEFAVPIEVLGILQEQQSGQEVALARTVGRGEYYLVWIGQEAAQEYGQDWPAARRAWAVLENATIR